MSAASFRVSVDLGPLLEANAAIAKAAFPLVGQAVAQVAEHGALTWRKRVWDAPIDPVRKSAYYESISWRMTGQMSAEIWSDSPLADEIENGQPSRDMKLALNTSMKVRRRKDGLKYLIIPFRHNTPGHDAHARPMPPEIYGVASELSASSVIGKTLRVSGQASDSLAGRWEAVAAGRSARGAGAGASRYLVKQDVYRWGGQLPEGLAPKLKPSHHSDPYAGMVRFDNSTPGARSSAYLTFRTMGQWSNGWILPAKPGLHIAQDIASGLQPVLDEFVGQAVTLGSLRR